MTKKEKLKKFVEDHKVGLAYFAGLAVGTIGVVISGEINNKRYKHLVDITNENLYEIIKSMDELGQIDLFTGICNTPLKLSDLGELGNIMKLVGATEDNGFTHFIACGQSK